MPAYQKPPLGIMESIHAAIPAPIRALTDFFIGGPDDVPMPVGMAKVPKPDPKFGATAPVMRALRELYDRTDLSKKAPTEWMNDDFVRRAYERPETRELIQRMEEAGGRLGLKGPGRYIKETKDLMRDQRASGPLGQEVADEMNNWTIEKLFPVIFGE